MAMTAKLWSISALAVELDMDRRTVAKRLQTVLPDGKLNGSPAWHLTTALEAIYPRRRAAAPPLTRSPARSPSSCVRSPSCRARSTAARR